MIGSMETPSPPRRGRRLPAPAADFAVFGRETLDLETFDFGVLMAMWGSGCNEARARMHGPRGSGSGVTGGLQRVGHVHASAQPRLMPGNDQPLDLAGALVDFGDLGVAEIALDRHFLRIAHAGVDLHRLVRDPHRR